MSAFFRGESCRLVVPGRDRFQSEHVHLLSPDRLSARHAELCSQYASECACNRESGLSAKLVRNKRIFSFAPGYLCQQFGRVVDRIIVEGNRIVISALERPHLRPSTIRILRIKEIPHAPQKSSAVRFPIWLWNVGLYLCEKVHLGCGCVIVERADIVPRRLSRGIEIPRTRKTV